MFDITLSYQVILSLTIAVIYFGLWTFIGMKGQKFAAAECLNNIILCLWLWSFGIAMYYFSIDSEETLFWIKFIYVVESFIPTLLVLMSFSLPEGHFTISRLKQSVLIIPSVLMFILFFNTSTMINNVYIVDGESTFVYGNWRILWDLQFNLYFIFALIRFYGLYRSVEGVTRDRIRSILFGTIAGLIVAGLTNVYMPIFQRFELLWLGPLLSLTFVVFVVYGIFKYELLGSKIIIQRSLVYSALISIVTLLYLVMIFILESFFKESIGYSSQTRSIGTITGIALFFFPLKKQVELLIEKHFFSGSLMQIVEQHKMLKQEVAQSERYKSLATLTAGIIHEIKNPLTALMGYSHYLPKKLDDRKFLDKFCGILDTELNRINEMIVDLTNYSKPTVYALKKADIVKIVDRSLEMLKSKIIEGRIHVVKQYDVKTEIYMKVDPNKIQQSFVSILSNSIEAMQANDELAISITDEDKRVKISFLDSGYGIAPDDLEKVFDPFFSLKDQNAGLGLSIAMGVVNEHGGNILINSTAGVGTQVQVELPKDNE